LPDYGGQAGEKQRRYMNNKITVWKFSQLTLILIFFLMTLIKGDKNYEKI